MTAENIRFLLLLVIFFGITLLVQPEALTVNRVQKLRKAQGSPENVLTRILTANFARFF